jgi:hypothetical protein
VAARRTGRSVWISASWNGATEIRHWQLAAGASRRDLVPTGRPARFAGLETTWRVRTAARYVAAEAVDRYGAVLRRSRPVRVSGP